MLHEFQGQRNRIGRSGADAVLLNNVECRRAVTDITYVVTVHTTSVNHGRGTADVAGKKTGLFEVYDIGATDKTAGSMCHGIHPLSGTAFNPRRIFAADITAGLHNTKYHNGRCSSTTGLFPMKLRLNSFSRRYFPHGEGKYIFGLALF